MPTKCAPTMPNVLHSIVMSPYAPHVEASEYRFRVELLVDGLTLPPVVCIATSSPESPLSLLPYVLAPHVTITS
jgi:hypothetical protein